MLRIVSFGFEAGEVCGFHKINFMKKENNFIFFSRKRWKIIKPFLFLSVAALFFVEYLIIEGLTKSPFSASFLNSQKKAIIDQISVSDKDKIRLYGSGPVLEIINKSGQYFLVRKETGKSKQVYLTFDDGPDPEYTQKILDVLEKENVKATFFVVGENVYKYPEVVKKIIANGHLIGAHTFSHTPENVDLYGKELKMYYEFELTQRMLEQRTGHTVKIFRLPYWGTEDEMSMNSLVLAVNARQRGYEIIGSTIDSVDWDNITSEKVVRNATDQLLESPVILLHDGGGDRSNTVDSLPKIINYYRNLGYGFGTVDEFTMDKEVLIPVDLKNKIMSNATISSYSFLKELPLRFSAIFIIGLASFGLHSVLICVFAILHKIKERKYKYFGRGFRPKVSVVIPAYNEEKVISKTIRSVLKSTYKRFEIIVVNDGSVDDTAGKLAKFEKNRKIKVITQLNFGKFSALNSGVESAKGEIIITVDADTQIVPDAIKKFVRHFKNEKVGAVAGNVKVGNLNNLLTRLQEIDYLMAINLERRAFGFLNSIFVVPGAVGAWRKSLVLEVGGFSSSTLAEDAELGLKIRKRNYRIIYDSSAIGYTEVPETILALLSQRFRWTFGILQTLWLHKEVIFNKKYGIFGTLVFPYIVLIQIPTLVIAPLIELSAIPIAVFVSYKLVIFSFLFMFATRLGLFIISSFLGGSGLKLVALIIPYRFFFQFLWYFIFDVAFFAAIKGTFITWHKLSHFGLVNMPKMIAPDLPNEK